MGSYHAVSPAPVPWWLLARGVTVKDPLLAPETSRNHKGGLHGGKSWNHLVTRVVLRLVEGRLIQRLVELVEVALEVGWGWLPWGWLPADFKKKDIVRVLTWRQFNQLTIAYVWLNSHWQKWSSAVWEQGLNPPLVGRFLLLTTRHLPFVVSFLRLTSQKWPDRNLKGN